VSVNTQNMPSITIPANLSDNSLSKFYEDLKQLLADHPESIAVDSSQLECASSGHVGALWQAHELCADTGVRMLLESPSPGLIRVLEILDLSEAFGEERDIAPSQLRQAASVGLGGQTETYADEFPADVDSINTALDRFLELIRKFQLPETTEYVLRTIFYEITTNIRAHAGLEEHGLIVFSLRAEDLKLTLVFADSGKPFDPTWVADDVDLRKVLKNRQIRGLGIPMICKLAEKISYKLIDGTINVFTVEVSRGDESGTR
jgi:anti-sigma regulatory factor (Ser/Thr protein kinase)